MKIAIDLGGTNVRVGLVDRDKIVKQYSESCPAQAAQEVVTNLIISMIHRLMTPEVNGIGVGVPSVVDAIHGIVYDVINIPSWKEVHLKEILEKEFGIRTSVDNDVNCFVWGEKCFGSAQPYHDVVGITLGTGVGSGIVIADQLYRGVNTGAGEIGSLPYLKSDYEHYCSSLFFASCSKYTGKELTVMASRGDAAALELWNQLGFHLGKLLQVVLFTYDPQAIIIGGGIATAAPYFERAMRNSMKQGFPYTHTVDNIQVGFSTLAGCNMLGASML